jgi:hypothetical protein
VDTLYEREQSLVGSGCVDQSESLYSWALGRLAQLARARASHARGHWFKSSIAHQNLSEHRPGSHVTVISDTSESVDTPLSTIVFIRCTAVWTSRWLL